MLQPPLPLLFSRVDERSSGSPIAWASSAGLHAQLYGPAHESPCCRVLDGVIRVRWTSSWRYPGTGYGCCRYLEAAYRDETNGCLAATLTLGLYLPLDGSVLRAFASLEPSTSVRGCLVRDHLGRLADSESGRLRAACVWAIHASSRPVRSLRCYDATNVPS